MLNVAGRTQTIINPGDLVILGVDANLGGSPDEISFACFKDITPGTEIQITDQGYERCYDTLWGSGEGGAKLTRTGPTITAGTVITLRTSQSYSPYIHFTYPDSLWGVANLGTGVPAASFNLNSGGDQVYCAQGGVWGSDTLCSNHYPGSSGKMLFAFSTSGSWVSYGNSTQKSGLYPGMSCYNMAPTTASDFVKYTGPLTAATQKDWITRISDVTNWTRYTTSANYLAGLPDLNTTVLPIIVGTDADWTPPAAPLCQTASPINLNALISGLGTPGGTWSGTGVSGNTFDPAGLNGTYNITYTNDCPCCISQTHTITVDAVAATASSNSALCVGSTLNLSASGGTNYTWSGPNSFSSSSQNPSIINATIADSGNYMVTVTDANGCSSTTQTAVVVNSNPVATASSNSSVCIGSTLNLFSGGGTSYSWNGPNSFTSAVQNPMIINVTAAASGNYTVTITDINGCSSTAQTAVIINPNPAASAGVDTSLCNGNSVMLNAGGGDTYTWSPSAGLNNTTINNPTASPSSTTTYTVAVTNSATGCSATDNIVVTVNDLPNADAGNDVSICPGSSTTLNASGGSIYLWSPSTGLSTTNVNNPTASPSTQTTYILTVTDANGCSQTDDVTVSIYTPPTADAGSDASICPGSSTILNASGGSTYAWSPSTGLSATNVNNPSASPSSQTIYSVTVTDLNGCTDTDDITVSLYSLPSIDAGNSTSICTGNSYQLNASGGNTYVWSPSTGLSSTNVSNPIASPSSTTTYVVTGTDVNGCSNTDDVTITIFALPNASAGNDTSVCAGGSVDLTASGGTTYLWSTGETTQIISVSPSSPSTYTVTVTNSDGCSATADVNIIVTAVPAVTLTADPGNEIYIGQEVTLTVNPPTYTIYTFYNGSTVIYSGLNNYIELNTLTTTDTIFVIATQNGCISEIDSIIIEIKNIPNAFTPINGDGKNDVFLKGLDMTILNRWGEKLYEGKDGWDGKYKGTIVSRGTYYYIIRTIDVNGNETELKGSVTIVN